MRTVSTLHEVRQDDHVWIPMSDGVRLAARLWRPTWADSQPVPAILEYIPHRQRDLTAHRDSIIHPYVAGHGYASARVDLRGSGDSEGVLTDAQPWCDGTVGMMGKSWGGVNSLQIASRQPLELGAVAAVAFSDDRYADDVHYMGGCLLGDNLSWPRRRRTVARHVVAAPASRRLLAARLDPRGLLVGALPGDGRQRVGRRLLQRRVPTAGGPRRAVQGP